MYCPSCGSNNVAELKFCPRCGTNLGIVSDALAGRPTDHSQLDERMVKLFKDYYRGRHSLMIGTVVTLIALFKIALFSLVPFPGSAGDIFSTLTTILLIYGIVALFFGVGWWSSSSSEIKAIERTTSRTPGDPLLHSREERFARLPSEPATITTAPITRDPIDFSGSVTEQTTRELEERKYQPPPGSQSKQTN